MLVAHDFAFRLLHFVALTELADSDYNTLNSKRGLHCLQYTLYSRWRSHTLSKFHIVYILHKADVVSKALPVEQFKFEKNYYLLFFLKMNISPSYFIHHTYFTIFRPI